MTISSNEIQVDYHVHSQYSYCSEDVTIEKLARLASERGLKQFFITDHSSHLYFREDLGRVLFDLKGN